MLSSPLDVAHLKHSGVGFTRGHQQDPGGALTELGGSSPVPESPPAVFTLLYEIARGITVPWNVCERTPSDQVIAKFTALLSCVPGAHGSPPGGAGDAAESATHRTRRRCCAC